MKEGSYVEVRRRAEHGWDNLWRGWQGRKHQYLPQKILGIYPMGDLGGIEIWLRGEMWFSVKSTFLSIEHVVYVTYVIWYSQHPFGHFLIHPRGKWSLGRRLNGLSQTTVLLRGRTRIWTLELRHVIPWYVHVGKGYTCSYEQPVCTLGSGG